MKRMRELMQKHIVAVARNTSIRSALKLMNTAHVSVAPVLEGNKLVGIIQSNRISGMQGAVEDVMSRPIFVLENDTIDVAARKMAKAGVPRLPVVNNNIDMDCIGMVSSTEIAHSIKK